MWILKKVRTNISWTSLINRTPTFEWVKIKTIGESPTPRANHSSCLLGDNLVIYGGRNSDLYKTR